MPVDKSARRIREMFGQVAARYDLLNRLLSLGIDQRWRRKTTRLAPPSTEGPVLDVCTGTADLALAYWKAGRGRIAVVGADFCRPMLAIGREKVARAGAAHAVRLVEADAEHLPFADSLFQVVSVAFGLRNVSDPDRGLREMARVCRPGGKVAVLEFSLPQRGVSATAYRWYFGRVLPRVGEFLSGNRMEAYRYLPSSVGEFPQGEELARRMEAAGLQSVVWRPFTLGVATLYVGIK